MIHLDRSGKCPCDTKEAAGPKVCPVAVPELCIVTFPLATL